MPGIHRLGKKEVELAKQPGQRLGDGGGLFLHVREKGAKYWSVQVTIKAAFGRGKRVELGLGPYPDVTLDQARDLAAAARELARSGTDPREERRKQLQKSQTFEEVCALAFEARKAELKGDGASGRWMSPLNLHVIPKIGDRPITEITQNDIVDVLKPLWHTKADTARKGMNRIGIVIKHGAAMGLDVDLQATDKAKALLGKSRHVAKNMPAMPWQEVPAFYGSLGEATTELALRLLILTGVRSGPLRTMHENQIDGDVWTIPAEDMKGNKGKTQAFRVPLSATAQLVVAKALEGSRDGYLFPSPRKGVISDMSMTQFMKRQGLVARPHGFRTSLRTWLNGTDAPYEVKEMVLSHKFGNSAAKAYDRDDFLEKRAVLLEQWANHVTGGTGQKLHLVEAG